MRAQETGSARSVELSRNNRSSPDPVIERRAGAPARLAAAPLASAVTVGQTRFESSVLLTLQSNYFKEWKM